MNTFAHELKIHPSYFMFVASGDKTFEIRENDRDFKVGEDVILREFHPERGYTGRGASFKIGYVTDFEQKPGYVVFSLLPNFMDPFLNEYKPSGGNEE